jgi:hypothetical protein
MHGSLTSFKHGMMFYSKTCDLAASILCRTLPAQTRGRSSNTRPWLAAFVVCLYDFFDTKGRYARPFTRFNYEISLGFQLISYGLVLS